MKTFKQVPPENQTGAEFDYITELPVIITGNRWYSDINEAEYREILHAIEDLQGAQEESSNPEEWPEFLEDLYHLFPPKDLDIFGKIKKHSVYTSEELAELKALFCADAEKWQEFWKNENGLICRMLSLQYGIKWKVSEIRGYSQGEWQYLFHPADLTKDTIRYIEDIYFEKGSEWINEEDEYPCLYYVPAYEDTRQFLAAEVGEKPEDITLLAFDGYIQTPKYREI